MALRFLSSVPGEVRDMIRNVSLLEDYESVACPESHGRGLIALCQAHPKLRVKRVVHLWRNAFPVWRAVRHHIVHHPNSAANLSRSSPRNVGAPLEPGPQSNQCAELVAIKIALDKVPAIQDVLIRSDSEYAIKCVTDWYRRWELSSWSKQEGEHYEHLDLINDIVNAKDLRSCLGAATKFWWVKGHEGDPENEAADKLAGRGPK